ncbi:MAG: integrase, partial [Legionellaceae bacterium]|nr:integrase [Legionellaceae bacterium]
SHYQVQTKQMGLRKCHGLRHGYAQRRYHEITKALDPREQGLICPLADGKYTKDLKGIEKRLDRQAREVLSREMGHSRLSVVKIYCG